MATIIFTDFAASFQRTELHWSHSNYQQKFKKLPSRLKYGLAFYIILFNNIWWFQNECTRVVIALGIAQFWSEIKLLATKSNHTPNIVITRLISDQIVLLSVQLPLFLETPSNWVLSADLFPAHVSWFIIIFYVKIFGFGFSRFMNRLPDKYITY